MNGLLTVPDERRCFVSERHPVAAAPVATARPLAAERPKLFVVREDDRATALVNELDRRISAPPHAVPLVPGRLQRFDNWAEGETAFRYQANGRTMTVHYPSDLSDDEAETLIAELAARL